MANNLEIDPATGDYVVENGRLIETDDLRVAAYFRLRTRKQLWLYADDDQFGSTFYLMMTRAGFRSPRLLENVARDALAPLIDDGRASTIEVRATDQNLTRTLLEVGIINSEGKPEQFTFAPLQV